MSCTTSSRAGWWSAAFFNAQLIISSALILTLSGMIINLFSSTTYYHSWCYQASSLWQAENTQCISPLLKQKPLDSGSLLTPSGPLAALHPELSRWESMRSLNNIQDADVPWIYMEASLLFYFFLLVCLLSILLLIIPNNLFDHHWAINWFIGNWSINWFIGTHR